MSGTFVILGTAVLAVLLAGYFAQRYLPPPTPKIVGIDLGTTYSCVGVYHAVTGAVDVLTVQGKQKCIPSVVAFTDSKVLVGYDAESQSEKNPGNTLYDAKRFIGKVFSREELQNAQKQYSFKLEADENGMVHYVVKVNGTKKQVKPEDVGAIIIGTLREAAERNLSSPVTKAVMSVPAEFDDLQRNYTRKAASLAGIEVFRLINEPTAAALAYGLHTKPQLQNVMVVDLGGGTLDVSILNVQGGMFLTQAMAGNNFLGGQDFNQRLLRHILQRIQDRTGHLITNKEDLQTLRLAAEEVKINLTFTSQVEVKVKLHTLLDKMFTEPISRKLFEEINKDLFEKVLEPIHRVLEVDQLTPEEVDEIVLVGGSTRIPKVQELIREFFGKELNTHVDPELAVATGVSVQAGIIGGMWPLTVSAVELPSRVQKIHVR